MRNAVVLLVCLVVLEAAVSATMLGSVEDAASQLCNNLRSLLPVITMMMLILGGIIYAAGQMMGAETRARANVWATACLTGALIAILIVVVAQPVLQTIYGDAGIISCDLPSS